MIHIVTMFPYINKIVRGTLDDEHFFHPEYITYMLDSMGIQTGKYLQQLQLDHQVHGMVGSQAMEFMDTTMNFQPVQMSKHNGLQITLMNEEECYKKLIENKPVLQKSDAAFYELILDTKLKQDDVIVFCEETGDFHYQLIRKIYDRVSRKAKLVVSAVHPKYVSMFEKQPCNVLVQSLQELKQHYGIARELDLASIVLLVKETVRSYGRIVILSVSSNCLLVFLGDEVYKATYKVTDPIQGTYIAAIVSGVLKSYEQTEDLTFLMKTIMSLSVGASLSSGLYIADSKVLEEIAETVEIEHL